MRDEVQLGSQKTLAALMPGAPPRPGRPEGKVKRKPYQAQNRRCPCGHCSLCEENARWERIYQEKFADVEYYSQHHSRDRSPIADAPHGVASRGYRVAPTRRSIVTPP